MKSICVMGGANIDVCGASIEPLRNFDSNPGTIEISFGGVGRNIAQICALLKQNVRFVTCFSSDNYGQLMQRDCEAMGMDCSDSEIIDDLPSSMYVAILDSDHDMRVAMSDMRILRRMEPQMIDYALKNLTKDDIIVMDANLDMESIHYILDYAPCLVAADPVSVSKAKRLKEYIGQISIFKPNAFEAEEMTGISIVDATTARQSLEWFLDRGVKEIIISMADKGVLFGTREKCSWIMHRTIQLQNATGGGDTLLGAYVSRRVNGENPEEAIRFAITAAVDTIEKNSIKRRDLNTERIEKEIEKMNMEVIEL